MLHRFSLPIILLLLSLISLVTLKSIAPNLITAQFVFFFLGGIAFWVTSRLRFTWMSQLSPIFFIMLCLSLGLTLIIGQVTKGSTRWINVGNIFHVQTSQLAVPLTLVFLSYLMTNKKNFEWPNLLRYIAVTLIPSGLIMIQPDLGTTIIYLTSIGVVFYLSPIKLKYFLYLTGIGCLALVFSWFFLIKPYQKQRITSFLAGSANTEASYNAQQALIAVGSGKTWGRGLGQGIQSHLKFLPERQTDFVFASLAEEVGFVGSATLVLLYLALFITVWRIAQTTLDIDQQKFCLGILVLFFFQTTVNIGMNLGLLPITGVTLPFISYGGSSIIASAFSLGLVQSIFIHRTRPNSLSLK